MEFFSGILGATACIVGELFIGSLITQIQKSFNSFRENKVSLLGNKRKNKQILLWNSFTEQFALNSFMKALLSSLEFIILLINFYFIIKVRGEVIKIDEACFGLYLLGNLQNSSKTLSQAIRYFSDFESSCTEISKFLNLSEIDFETVDIYDNKNSSDGVMQSMLWEETSVKLGNDYLFGNRDDDAES